MELPVSEAPSPLWSVTLSLPPEIRDHIYEAALNWPITRISDFAKTVPLEPGPAVRPGQPLCTVPRPRYGPMSTPSVLLLNRQITLEALEVLYGNPLILDTTPPCVPQLGQPMDMP